jgi:hypothetical protein
MKYEVEYNYIHGREIPATYHNAIKKISNAVKKGKLHPIRSNDTSDTIFNEKKGKYFEVVSLFGLFLNETERERFDFNDQFVYGEKGVTVRKLLGINKLEVKTIFGMKLKHLKAINDQYFYLTEEYEKNDVHLVGNNKAIKTFKQDFLAYLEAVLAQEEDYINPGIAAI